MFEEKTHIKRSRKRSASRAALFDSLALGKQCDNPVIASVLAGITAPLACSSADAVDTITGYFDLLLSRFLSEPAAQAEVSDEDLMFRMDDVRASSDAPLSAQLSSRPRRRSPNTSVSSAEFTYSSDADEDTNEDRSSDEASWETPSDHAASILSAYYFLVSRWRVALQDPKRGELTEEDLTLFSQLVGHALLLFRSVHGDITENLACYPQAQDLRQWEKETFESRLGPIVPVSQPIPIPKRKQSQYAARSASSVPSSYLESRSESWGRF